MVPISPMENFRKSSDTHRTMDTTQVLLHTACLDTTKIAHVAHGRLLKRPKFRHRPHVVHRYLAHGKIFINAQVPDYSPEAKYGSISTLKLVCFKTGLSGKHTLSRLSLLKGECNVHISRPAPVHVSASVPIRDGSLIRAGHHSRDVREGSHMMAAQHLCRSNKAKCSHRCTEPFDNWYDNWYDNGSVLPETARL